jgi:hypothetical protein
MPRRTYRHRLQDLIASPAISSRDKDFANSLLRYYERKGSLTSGRVSWVKTLEERYNPDALAANAIKGQETLERLNRVCERTGASSWARGFINSLQGQVMGGRKLSEKQIVTLKKIEAEHSDEAIADLHAWQSDYREDKDDARSIFAVAIDYYRATSYFGSVVASFDASAEFVPDLATFNKMTKNKFALKAITAHFAAPLYAVGSLVKLRTGAPRKGWGGAGAPLAAFKVPCVVIAVDAQPVTSAAKGAKVYKLLPMGMPETIFMEERYIMKSRTPKRKGTK